MTLFMLAGEKLSESIFIMISLHVENFNRKVNVNYF